MNRREFLQLTMAAAAAASLGGCAGETPRYVAPVPMIPGNGRLLLQNASLIDVEAGRLMPQKRLLIENGRIAAILKDADPVSDAATVDLEGAFVSPGLINAHAHMTMPCGLSISPAAVVLIDRQIERNAEECVKNGVTCVRDMLAITSKFDQLKTNITSGQIIGPRLVTSCAVVVQNSYCLDLAFWGKDKRIKVAETPEAAREAVRAAFDEGADFIKLFHQPFSMLLPARDYQMMDLKMVAAITDEADKLGRKVSMHQTDHGGMHTALDGGIRDFQHVIRDHEISDADVERLLASGGMVVPTLTAPFGLVHEYPGDKYWENDDVQSLVALRARTLKRLLARYTEPDFAEGAMSFFKRWSNPSFFDSKRLLPSPYPPFFTRAVVIGTANIRKLYDAGVPMGCGNDGGIPFVFQGAMDLEMLLNERIGIPSAEVLKMATIHNARLLGMENEIGSLAPGKSADIAVFSKNPLLRAADASNPLMVFREGHLLVDRRERV